MIRVSKLYQDFKSRENTWQGGHANIRNFESWVHEIQIDMQNDLIKAFQQSQIITDNLRNFLVSTQVVIQKVANSGIVEYPKDYRYFCSLRYYSKTEGGAGVLCSDMTQLNKEGECKELTEEDKAEAKHKSVELTENSIDMVTNNRWGSVSSHKLLPPSLLKPKATQNNTGFKVLPKELGIVVLDYIAIPQRPILAFSYDANHNEIYNEQASTNLKWGEEMIPDIMARLKKRYSAFTANSEGYVQGEQERGLSS